MLRKRTGSTRKEQQMGHLTSDSGSDGCLQYGVAGQKQKTSSLFNLPGLFIGLTPKGLPDCDSVRSPTSPLDFKLLSNLGGSFRSPRYSLDGHHQSWDCSKVGLGIVDSLEDEDDEEEDDDGKLSGKVTGSTHSKSILFGPQIRTKTTNLTSRSHLTCSETPRSLPKNGASFAQTRLKSPYHPQKGSGGLLFETEEDALEPYLLTKLESFSLDSKRFGSPTYGGLADRERSECGSFRNYGGMENASVDQEESPSKTVGGESPNLEDSSPSREVSSAAVVVGFGNGVVRQLSPSEIELSEDYTCVISHGPNPKTTHIFGDRILESHPSAAGFRSRRGGVEKETPPDPGKRFSKLPTSYPCGDLLSFCCFCKELEEGKDRQRGEEGFCSLEEILIDEVKDSKS